MGSSQETSRLKQRNDQLFSRRMTRRTALVGGATFALGGMAAAIGCGPNKPEVSSYPENSPKKEGLTNQLQFVPFEILDHFPQDPRFYGIPTPEEGMRWVIVKTGIQNLTDKPLQLTEQFVEPTTYMYRKTTLTTAEGYEYPIDSHFERRLIDVTGNINPIQIPPGFRFRSIQQNPILNNEYATEGSTLFIDSTDNSDGGFNASMSNFIFQVPQSATGLKLNIPGYDPIDLDSVQPISGFDQPDSDFKDAVGGSVLTGDERVRVSIKDFARLNNPQSVITPSGNSSVFGEYNFFAVTLNYANLDQGHVSAGRLPIYSIDNDGNVFRVYTTENDTNNEGFYGFIGFDEIGPGFSKDLTLYLAYPKSVKDVKFVLQGQELGVFNTPLVAS